jgi:hypothetical protein
VRTQTSAWSGQARTFIERDGVHYTVDGDLLRDVWVVKAKAPPRQSYKMILPPVTSFMEDEPTIDFLEEDIIEIPALHLHVVLPGQEVRDRKKWHSVDHRSEDSVALEMGIEKLERMIEEKRDPALAERRRLEQEEYDRVMKLKAKAETEKIRKKLEAQRKEEERLAREQDALEALPEFGMF